jgi:hypothetical protein
MNLMQKVCENEKLYPAESYTDVRAADKRTTRSSCTEPLVGKFEISRHLMFDQLHWKRYFSHVSLIHFLTRAGQGRKRGQMHEPAETLQHLY